MESPGRKTFFQSFLLGGGNKLTLLDTDPDPLVPQIFADPQIRIQGKISTKTKKSFSLKPQFIWKLSNLCFITFEHNISAKREKNRWNIFHLL